MNLRKIITLQFRLSLFISLCLFFIPVHQVVADDTKVREIMQKVEDRDRGDNLISNMEMILIDKQGNKRIRKTQSYYKYKGEDRYSIRWFLHPADVEGTGFLTYDYDDASKDDDQWLYLPTIKKTKRIASTDQSRSFMGSDFNYSDLTVLEVDDYDYKLLKEDEVKGHKVWVIESIPRNEKVIDDTGYKKSMIFVRQDNYVIIRNILWVSDSQNIKYYDVKSMKLVDDIWLSIETHMTSKKGDDVVHKTILKREKYRFDDKIEFPFFSKRQLEKGI